MVHVTRVEYCPILLERDMLVNGSKHFTLSASTTGRLFHQCGQLEQSH